jgi:isocitrate/isopropylmalate dehydrogenase
VLSSEEALREITKYSCKLAKKKNKFAIVHKSNVRKIDMLFRNVCRWTASDHAVESEDMLVDSMAYNFMMHVRSLKFIHCYQI